MTQSAARAAKGGGLLFAAMMLVNVLNYGYAVVLGRVFGPEEYGAYASFTSLFLLVSLLPLTLQQVTARYAALGATLSGYVLRLALVAGAVLAALLAGSSAWLAPLLKLNPWWLVLLGVVAPVYAWTGVLRGEAQGRQAFPAFGSNLVLEHAVKILLTPLFLAFVPGASGAVAATLAALPLTALHLRRFQASVQARHERAREAVLYAGPVFANLAAQAVIINADILMVKALLPAHEAGIYAAVAMIGRVVFYSSWAVGAAVFPLVSARQGDGGSSSRLLWIALGTVALISGGITVVCAAAPQFVLGVLYGDAYLAGATLVGSYALLTTFYAVSNVISNHYLALGRHSMGYLPVAGAALQVALIATHHGTLQDVVWSQLVARGALLLGSVAAVAYFERRRS